MLHKCSITAFKHSRSPRSSNVRSLQHTLAGGGLAGPFREGALAAERRKARLFGSARRLPRLHVLPRRELILSPNVHAVTASMETTDQHSTEMCSRCTSSACLHDTVLCWTQSLECRTPREAEQFIAKALEVAVTESARQRLVSNAACCNPSSRPFLFLRKHESMQNGHGRRTYSCPCRKFALARV